MLPCFDDGLNPLPHQTATVPADVPALLRHIHAARGISSVDQLDNTLSALLPPVSYTHLTLPTILLV